MKEREKGYYKLNIKYYPEESGEVVERKVKRQLFEENEFADALAMEMSSFLIEAGWNPEDATNIEAIEWLHTKYKGLPSEYGVGNEFLITLMDRDEEVTSAIWNGTNFVKYTADKPIVFNKEDIKAWTYLPYRCDSTELWH